MDENDKTDGCTAMERLARELAGFVIDEPEAASMWCDDHGFDTTRTTYAEDQKRARADISRRIEDARGEDECEDTYSACELKRLTGMYLGGAMTTMGEVAEMVAVVEGWKAKVAELDDLCVRLGVDDADEAMMVAGDLLDDCHELATLKAAGRVMPEGLSWPRYDDGEPVRVGDEVDGDKVAWVVLNSIRYEICNRDNSCLTTDLYGKPVERPAPKAVGADGVEVKAGETVWLAEEYRDKALSTGPSHNLHYVAAMEEMTVSKVKNGRYFEVAWMYGEGSRWCPTSWLTHKRPDSWERLREDARKVYTAYWGCIGFCCDECPALVDGKDPIERYSTANCHNAMGLDLVARAERLAGVGADA